MITIKYKKMFYTIFRLLISNFICLILFVCEIFLNYLYILDFLFKRKSVYFLLKINK